MVTLYVKDNCPFSALVLKVVDELEAPVTILNVAERAQYDAVVAQGGKAQFPFMTDDDPVVMMYGSNDITSYLMQKFIATIEE